jgi:hypothetical protein
MRLKAIFCEVLARQAYYVAALSEHVVDITLLGKGLHQKPDTLRTALQEQLNAVEPGKYDAVLLGYGLCSNAIIGLVSPQVQMVVPRAHDCITLFLGSCERYAEEFRANPGTYWYTPDYIERIIDGNDSGLVALGSDTDGVPMDKVYEEYVAKYGQDNADYLMEVMGAWKQHYNRAAYIQTDEMKLPDYTAQVQEQAQRRGWNYEQLAGSMVIVRELIEGQWDENRFLIVPPGRSLTPTYDSRIIAECSACNPAVHE